MKYHAEELRELSTLLDELLDLPEPEREPWLARLEGSAAALGPTLREMLARQTETGGILERGPSLAGHARDGGAGVFDAGEAIGPYRLLRLIGHGGMGEVWLAERSDGQLKRHVALKLPTLSLRRSVLVQRFARERDILGALVHPHIARLYDAGITEDGQPFMALEYVEGTPITEAAHAMGLDARGRVRLVRQVMDAVQYAHANLVIHRDIKPGNVLVTREGRAILLDFGIAKLVEEESATATESDLTRQSGRALTLHYAAPEQVSGAPISTAVDVWALGVLLYELLAGVRPHEGEERRSVEHAVMTRDPPRPSQRKSAVMAGLPKGAAADLDTIVLKALKKNPSERYVAVSAFSADLDHWLQGKPVEAQPDSAWYRTRRFVSRNRLAVAAAGAATAAILATASVAVVFAIQARNESARAVSARNFMIDLFRSTDPDLSQGKDVSVKQLLAQGHRTVAETMEAQPLLQADLLRGIGDAYQHHGDWQAADNAYALAAERLQQIGRRGDAAGVHLDRALMRLFGSWDVAAAAFVLEQAEAMHPDRSSDDEFIALHAISQASLAETRGDLRAMRQWRERARPHADRALRDNSLRTVAAIRSLAGVEAMLHEYPAGIDRLKALLARLRTDRAVIPSALVGVIDSTAQLQAATGRYREAVETLDEADAICRSRFYEKSVQCTFTQYLLASTLMRIGFHERAMATVPILLHRNEASGLVWGIIFRMHAFVALGRTGRLDGYPELTEEVRELAASSDDARWQTRIMSLQALALVSLGADRAAEAEAASERALATIAEKGPGANRYAAAVRVFKGLALHAQGRFEEALKEIERAHDLEVAQTGAAHPWTQLVSIHRARPLWVLGRTKEAIAILDAATPILRGAMGPDAPNFVKIEALRRQIAASPPATPEAARAIEVLL